MGSLSVNTENSSDYTVATPLSPVSHSEDEDILAEDQEPKSKESTSKSLKTSTKADPATAKCHSLELDGEIEEIQLFNSRIAELRIRRSLKSPSEIVEKKDGGDKKEEVKKKEDDNKKEEDGNKKPKDEEESHEAKIERLCKPENSDQLFEYRREKDFWGAWEKLENKDKFYDEDDVGVELMLMRRHNGKRDLVLWSRYLCQKYREIASKHKFEGVDIWTDRVVISTPYCPLFHCLETIGEAIDIDPNAEPIEKARWSAIKDLAKHGFIANHFKTAREEMAEGRISSPELWALFEPEDLVVVKDAGPGGLRSIMRLTSIQKMQKESMLEDDCAPRGWTLKCVQMSWTGTQFCEELKTIKIRHFGGSKKISDLRVVPLRLYPDRIDIERLALARGQKYAELCLGSARTMMYEGVAKPFLHASSFPWEKSNEPEQIQLSGKVIIDPKALVNAAKFANLSSCSLSKSVPPDEGEPNLWSSLGIKQIADKGEMQTHEVPDMKLLPPTYPIFSLDEQEWYNVGVENLSEIDWQYEAFDKLEITDDQKRLLAGLTKAHSLGADKRSQDMISGKGKGLVILLYGPPGVGKTLTAEALSELTEKPLYRVNLGAISSMDNWEAKIDHIFHCAHAWNAILLIDEAEVVLEERSVQGGTQNRWASVFLRKIEYFQGILILTTNLVNVIDEAFQSRISIGIEYPELDMSARTKIFRNFISRMDPSIANRRELTKMAPEWAEEDLNARQIRNVLQICESLVIGRGSGRVEVEDVEMVMRHTLDFTKSVRDNKVKGVMKKKKESIYNKW
ncbi:MAG: hypothetical protein Q9227_003919 [Pyrenula ochraceoflavens]